MIEAIKAPIRRHWPRFRLRTILLLTFLFVAALPGVGALFLRVYENTLVRQTEAELVAQSAALSAIAAAEWPGSLSPSGPAAAVDQDGVAGGTLSTIDLRTTPVLPERPDPVPVAGPPLPPDAQIAAARLAPVLRATAQTTLASILLLDDRGRILVGAHPGESYPDLPEVRTALRGHPDTVLRRNGACRARYALEWLSRASDLRIHHARPVVVNGRAVGVLLLSRSPRALFRGLYEDRGKILIGIAAIFATLVVLSGLLSRGIARPIEALSDATRRVASGSGDVPAAPTTAAIEIQALYADFATMTDAIARRSRYLRDFAHAVSHEFKTPLASIGGTVEILEDHGATMREDERRRFFSNIQADVGRLSQLVTRLLELARADMTEVDASARVALAPILHRIADAFDGSGLTVRSDIPATLPLAAMPGPMLETILANLIDNSRQAGASEVMVQARQHGATIEVEVTDNGPGIPIADRARIFEPFFTSHRAIGGTGLGLPIARSLLQSYQGDIALLPCDVGGAFRIVIPATPEEGSPLFTAR